MYKFSVAIEQLTRNIDVLREHTCDNSLFQYMGVS